MPPHPSFITPLWTLFRFLTAYKSRIFLKHVSPGAVDAIDWPSVTVAFIGFTKVRNRLVRIFLEVNSFLSTTNASASMHGTTPLLQSGANMVMKVIIQQKGADDDAINVLRVIPTSRVVGSLYAAIKISHVHEVLHVAQRLNVAAHISNQHHGLAVLHDKADNDGDEEFFAPLSTFGWVW